MLLSLVTRAKASDRDDLEERVDEALDSRADVLVLVMRAPGVRSGARAAARTTTARRGRPEEERGSCVPRRLLAGRKLGRKRGLRRIWSRLCLCRWRVSAGNGRGLRHGGCSHRQELSVAWRVRGTATRLIHPLPGRRNDHQHVGSGDSERVPVSNFADASQPLADSDDYESLVTWLGSGNIVAETFCTPPRHALSAPPPLLLRVLSSSSAPHLTVPSCVHTHVHVPLACSADGPVRFDGFGQNVGRSPTSFQVTGPKWIENMPSPLRLRRHCLHLQNRPHLEPSPPPPKSGGYWVSPIHGRHQRDLRHLRHRLVLPPAHPPTSMRVSTCSRTLCCSASLP